MVLKKLLKLLSISLGEGYKAVYKQFEVHHSTERTIIRKRETFKTAANLPRSGSRSKLNPRSDYPMLRETGKKLNSYISTLQASVGVLNVKVHHGSIRRRLNKYGLFWRVSRRKAVLSKKNMAAQLRLAKLHLNKQTSGKMSFRQTKVEMSCHDTQCHICRSPNSWQLSNMVVEGCWFGLFLQPQLLGTLQALSSRWTLDTKVF